LVALIVTAVYYLSPAITRTWFFNSDEYVVVGEVIRFSRFDFHQRFFDMPGTPFIFFVSACWSLFSGAASIFVPAAGGSGLSGFTFQHLDWLFYLARASTVFFYMVSLILCFCVVDRLLNKPAACFAALMLAMSPIYTGYSSLVRVESMSMCLVLWAILSAYSGLASPPKVAERRPNHRDPFLIAGVLAGIAAGARLYSMMASMPLLYLITVLHQRPTRFKYPRWVRTTAPFALPVVIALGIVGFRCSYVPTDYPHAVALFRKPALALALLPLVAVASHRSNRLRSVLLAIAPPEVLKLGIGFVAGIIVAVPTLFSQSKYFLMSMEMYSTGYKDFYRIPWPYFKDLSWLVKFYVNTGVPDRILLYSLIVGILLILVTRRRILFPYVFVIVFFFFSKPIDLIAAPHHLILWLPFYATICAYPLAEACSWISNLSGFSTAVTAGAIALSPALALTMTNGLAAARANTAASEVRLQNVSQASAWMAQNSKHSDDIVNAYSCFDAGIFFKWLRDLEVPVPETALDGRVHAVWWVRQSELASRAGLACLAPVDVEGVKKAINPTDAHDVADPYHDPRYQLTATFGREPNRVDVFRFDFSPRLPMR
jgi:hypothetical protein